MTRNLRLSIDLAGRYLTAAQWQGSSQARHFLKATDKDAHLNRMEANIDDVENAFHLWQSLIRKRDRHS